MATWLQWLSVCLPSWAMSQLQKEPSLSPLYRTLAKKLLVNGWKLMNDHCQTVLGNGSVTEYLPCKQEDLSSDCLWKSRRSSSVPLQPAERANNPALWGQRQASHKRSVPSLARLMGPGSLRDPVPKTRWRATEEDAWHWPLSFTHKFTHMDMWHVLTWKQIPQTHAKIKSSNNWLTSIPLTQSLVLAGYSVEWRTWW